MDNSFYYFFSATPQALAAILALFGVFVVFKIQAIKNQLIGIGKSIIDEVQSHIGWKFDTFLTHQEHNYLLIDALNSTIHEHNIKELHSLINKIGSDFYKPYKNRFNGLNDFLESLIKNTIYWSIFTAVVIIVCLTILSQGDYFLNNLCLLTLTFWSIIGLMLICFFGLIYILIKSLREF